MSLENTIKELKDQIEEEKKKEAENDADQADDGVVEQAAEDQPEEKEPEKAEEKPAEEAKEEPKSEAKTEEPQDNAGWARLRREKDAAERKAQQLEEKLATKAEKTDEPAQEVELPSILKEVVEDHNRRRAWEELTAFESEARTKNKDYDGVAGAYTAAIAQSFRQLHPDLAPSQVIEMTKKHILDQAASLAIKGHANPAEEMYNRAKEMGFRAPEPKEEVPAKEEKLKPDMAKVAENRKKSAGLTGAPGKAEGIMTKQAAADLSVSEWQKLPAEEKRRLLYG